MALDDLNRAIELNPNLEVAYANRAWVYRQLGDETSAAADDARCSMKGKSLKVRKLSWAATLVLWLGILAIAGALGYCLIVFGARAS